MESKGILNPPNRFMKKIKEEVSLMFSIEPVIINIFALTLCCSILLMLKLQIFSLEFGTYHNVIFSIIQLLMCYQILKSSSKSLILPLITTTLFSLGIFLNHQFNFNLVGLNTMRRMMEVGLSGLGIFVFCIR